MERTMTATNARIHFGEVLRQVAQGKRIIVKRTGRPQAVILSPLEYERLKATGRPEGWQEALEQAIQVGSRIQARRGGQPLAPPPEEIIHQMREERSEQLAGLH